MKKLSLEAISNELIIIISELLKESGAPRKAITMQASLQRLGIDSLTRAELLQRIEKIFSVTIPLEVFMKMDLVIEIAEFIQKAEPKRIRRSRNYSSSIQIQYEKSAYDPAQAATLIDLILNYAELSPNKTHICFQHDNGTEELVSYKELLDASLKVAGGLKALGIKEDDTVAIMQPSHPNFFYAFFGTLLAGAIPVPIYPPFRMHMLEAYAKTEAHILRSAEVRLLITFGQAEKFSQLLQGFVPSLKHVTTVPALLTGEAMMVNKRVMHDDFAFIQYTSGSTSNPKGVLLTHGNLLANIRGYGKAINVTSDDVAVSWLPLYHDMGLIGMWLGSLYHGVPLVLMTPFAFLNRPERWLWTIHNHRGTLSGAPNFAYELCTRKIDLALIEGLDLSSWRMAANGAEKIYPRTLADFNQKFGRFGLSPSTLAPMYGLAESSVALTIPDMEETYHIDYVQRDAFENKRMALPATKRDANALAFVGCGKPLDGHAVRIVNDENETLAERHVGNLQFQGPSSLQGYYNNPAATSAIFHEGWWDTGDLAYLVKGELYVTGRRKDLIIKAGRNIYPLEIEEVVGTVKGVRQGCVAVFGSADQKRASEQIVVVAETRVKDKAQRQQLISDIKKAVSSNLEIVPDHIELVAPHTVPKTSSGKLQRAACKKLYEAGKLQGWRLPPWVQVVKLTSEVVAKKMLHGLSYVAKALYSAYVLLLVGLSLPVVWLLLQTLKRDGAARVCQYWARGLLLAAGCRLKVSDKSILQQEKPVIYTANHASYVDALVMLAVLPIKTRFIGKKEIFSAPLLKTFVTKLDYIPVDRMDLSKGAEDTSRIQSAIKAGYPVLIFPEGTFGYAAGLRPFRLGAFKVAIDYGVPVCPISMHGTRQILRDGEFLLSPHKVNLQVMSPIEPEGDSWEAVTTLKNEVRAQIAAHCQEPTLDFIAGEVVAPSK